MKIEALNKAVNLKAKKDALEHNLKILNRLNVAAREGVEYQVKIVYEDIDKSIGNREVVQYLAPLYLTTVHDMIVRTEFHLKNVLEQIEKL